MGGREGKEIAVGRMARRVEWARWMRRPSDNGFSGSGFHRREWDIGK